MAKQQIIEEEACMKEIEITGKRRFFRNKIKYKYIHSKSKEFISYSFRKNKSSRYLNSDSIICEETSESCDDNCKIDTSMENIDYEARHRMAVDALLRGDLSKRISKKIEDAMFNGPKKMRSNPFRKRIYDEEISIELQKDLSLQEAKESPSLVSFLSFNCRLQKDEGEGLDPGAAVRVVGREATLEQLRRKTDKINHHLKMNVTIEKGDVKLTNQFPPETRSILVFKMGFFSMKYGLLLQWEEDGLIELIVLRKMVCSSFMDPCPNLIAPADRNPTVQSNSPKGKKETIFVNKSTEPIDVDTPIEVIIESEVFGVEASIMDLIHSCVPAVEKSHILQ
mmetsp:Transcript_10155/g.12547  ORF Transcript_10155/g.12547 Transcript_10155/m.12547 type:complete len:338 (-) Transcript_10155:62-1075(-)